MAKAKRVALDSSCFIAWANRGETESEEVLNALDVTMLDMIAGRVKIVASQLIAFEVRMETVEMTDKFHNQLLACPHFESFVQSPAVTNLAKALQDRLHDSGRRAKFLDLIHVATAITAGATELWTTDKKMILWHSEGIIKEIRICLPYVDQAKLDLF